MNSPVAQDVSADFHLQAKPGMEFESSGELDSAARGYSRALERIDLQAAQRQGLVVRQLDALRKLGRFEDGMAMAQAEMSRWAHWPDLLIVFGDLLLDWAAARPALAPSLLPMIESSWRRAWLLGDAHAEPGLLPGRGGRCVAHNLALMFEALTDAPKARHWHARAATMRRLAGLVATAAAASAALA